MPLDPGPAKAQKTGCALVIAAVTGLTLAFGGLWTHHILFAAAGAVITLTTVGVGAAISRR